MNTIEPSELERLAMAVWVARREYDQAVAVTDAATVALSAAREHQHACNGVLVAAETALVLHAADRAEVPA